jgi:hypothetical protein
VPFKAEGYRDPPLWSLSSGVARDLGGFSRTAAGGVPVVWVPCRRVWCFRMGVQPDDSTPTSTPKPTSCAKQAELDPSKAEDCHQGSCVPERQSGSPILQ